MCEREQEELMIKSQINPNLKFYQKFISFLINLINIEYVIIKFDRHDLEPIV